MSEPVLRNGPADVDATVSIAPRGEALILSLVHPAFLAPLYAVAQVLRDTGYNVILFSFSSPVLGAVDIGRGITLHDMGSHSGTPAQRRAARRRFTSAVRSHTRQHPPSVIFACCPFSVLLAVQVAKENMPVVYLSYETYDVGLRDLQRSPASALRNWRALRALARVSLICTPSEQRADWLQRRAHLRTRPQVVLNAPHSQSRCTANTAHEVRLSALLPKGFLERRIVIHTGNVSATQAIIELVESMQWWPDDAVLVVTNVGDTPYAQLVRERASSSPRLRDIALLPLLARDCMLALQGAARVGVSLLRAGDNLESSMPAPNKVGEYLHAGLLVVGVDSSYMRMLADRSVALLSPSLEPRALATAIGAALQYAAEPGSQQRVLDVAHSWYHMSEQFKPVLRYLSDVRCSSPSLQG